MGDASNHARRGRRRRLVAATMLVVAVALPPSSVVARQDEPVVLRPGDTLLDHLAAMEVERFPGTNLRPKVAAALGELLAGGRLTVDESAWIEGPTFPMARQFARVLRVPGAVSRWRTRPPAHLDLSLGVPWFTHEGRAARHMRDVPGAELAASRRIYWLDAARPMLFWWDPGAGFLRALGSEPPGPVAFGFLASPETAAEHWEWDATRGGEAPATAADLSRRASLGEVDRPCVSAPRSAVSWPPSPT